MVTVGPFTVRGSLPEAELQAHAQDTLQWARQRLQRQYFPVDPPPLDVWLYGDAASYEQGVREHTGAAPGTPYGFYSEQPRGLFMNISTGGGTLIHELVHPYLATNFPACPPWFNEGLASLYEQCEDRHGEIWGLPNWRLPQLQEAIRRRELGSFERLLNLDQAGFYGDQRSLNYAQARYLCLYLQEHGQLRDFYRALQAEPAGTAVLSRCVGPLGPFQSTWERWVLNL